MYELLLTNADGTTKSATTQTVEEALNIFMPTQIKGKVVIDAKKGTKSVNKVIFVPQAKRMFYNPVALKLFARNIERSLS